MRTLRFALLLTAAAALIAVPASANLVITGAFDGPLTGGIPKGIELYACDDIPDLSIYGVGSANNGGGTDGEEFTFPAISVAAGTFIYVSSDSTSFHDFFGFDSGNYSSAMLINGDDAIELFENGVVIDVFGDINVDGSFTAWDYLDGWAYRVSNTGPDGSTFVLENWTFSGINGLEGGTTNDTCTVPFPLGTFGGCETPVPVENRTWGSIKQLNN